MQGSNTKRHTLRNLLLGLSAVAALSMTGCQSEFGGQTLPSPYYMDNNVQYYPAGAEMKLSQEAAAQKAANQNVIQQQQQRQ